jgi:hypothetical protein
MTQVERATRCFVAHRVVSHRSGEDLYQMVWQEAQPWLGKRLLLLGNTTTTPLLCMTALAIPASMRVFRTNLRPIVWKGTMQNCIIIWLVFFVAVVVFLGVWKRCLVRWICLSLLGIVVSVGIMLIQSTGVTIFKSS